MGSWHILSRAQFSFRGEKYFLAQNYKKMLSSFAITVIFTFFMECTKFI